MEKEGSEVSGLRLLKVLGARSGEGKGGGGVGSVPRGGRRWSGEGPGAAVGCAERPAVALARRAWAVALWPGGQQLGAKGREVVAASGVDRWGWQHSAAGAVLNRFKRIQICPNFD
jgi:hypothetical protein